MSAVVTPRAGEALGFGTSPERKAANAAKLRIEHQPGQLRDSAHVVDMVMRALARCGLPCRPCPAAAVGCQALLKPGTAPVTYAPTSGRRAKPRLLTTWGGQLEGTPDIEFVSTLWR